MTLIIGVHCKDGVVLGADSIRTFGTLIEQEVSNKIQIDDGDVLIATSGVVGLSQLVKHELRECWHEIKHQEKISVARNSITHAMLKQIDPAFRRARDFKSRFEGCSSIIALPFDDRQLLLQYDIHANSMEVTPESPFASIGSGSIQADPFLAFIKRTFWNDQAPENISEGTFGVLWTLDHVSRVNAGLGVGGRSRVAILHKQSNKWQAEFLSDYHLAEHKEAIIEAEDNLRSFRNRFNPARNGGDPSR